MTTANFVPGGNGITGPYQKVYATSIDEDNEIIPPPDTNIDGNKKSQNVIDETGVGLLSSILKELKIMNLHLSILTDNTINKTEVE